MNQPLVIIGTGLAGYMLAKEFRKLNKEKSLVILTKDDGCFYSKPLLSTALTHKKTPTNLVVYDAKIMAQQLNARIYTHCCVSAINPKTCAVFLNEETIKSIEYSRLVIACGAEKIKLPLQVQGNAVQNICSVNSLTDYRTFHRWLKGKKRIAVLGAGLVGCEFANDLVNVGYQVDIIAPEYYPLANLVPEPIGRKLQDALTKKGVTWHMGQVATEIGQKKMNYKIMLSDGDSIIVDGVFSAIGIRPCLELAKTAGIQTNYGIVVDRYLKTNIPHIFALGDCAEVEGKIKQFVAPLLQCAQALAKILVGGREPVHYPAMPIVIKTPACPIVTSPPPVHVKGEWHMEGQGDDLCALFYDEHSHLRGFSLMGSKMRDKVELAKQLPLVFEE